MRSWLFRLLLLLGVLVGSSAAAPVRAQEPAPPMRASWATDCVGGGLQGMEAGILCDKVLRIGLRADYPRFAVATPEGRAGFEVDIAREIAARLGVTPQFTTVTPVNRLAKLEAGEIDLVIATMGHNTQRDPTVRFIRPHYYQSESILVGPKDAGPVTWPGLTGRLVCATLGNFSNMVLAPSVGRLMLFARPQQLVDALKGDMCPLIAHDDTLLLSLTDPEGEPARFERKLGFATIPWGMAMPPEVSPRLAALMSDVLIAMHREGRFVALAQKHDVPADFLIAEQERWRSPVCRADDAGCLAPPLDVGLTPSPVAELGKRIESALGATLGVQARLGFMESEVAWRLFLQGLGTSLLAAVLVLVGTALSGLAFARLLISRRRAARVLGRTLLTVLQNVPVMLVMVFVAALSVSVFSYSFVSAMLGAMASVAVYNGGFAGAAVAEAYRITDASASPSRFEKAIGIASPQFDGYLVNAVRGAAGASAVGVPDLVSAFNDIMAFSGSQSLYYVILVAFYVVMVLAVAQATRRLMPRFVPGWGS